MPGIQVDQDAQAIAQMTFKLSKWTTENFTQIMRNWIESSKKVVDLKLDNNGRLSMDELQGQGNTTVLPDAIPEEKLKIMEKCFKECGVGRWSVTQLNKDEYAVTFLDKKATEVEIAMKKYVNTLDQEIGKYSKDKAAKYSEKVDRNKLDNNKVRVKEKTLDKER